MLSKTKEYFDIFGIDPCYKINKNLLKKRYYSLIKSCHPDINNNLGEAEIFRINKAYSTLSNDFERAKLFGMPSENIEQRFLEDCLALEERIGLGENITELLKKKINECKEQYNNPDALSKWGYYQRLLDLSKKNSP